MPLPANIRPSCQGICPCIGTYRLWPRCADSTLGPSELSIPSSPSPPEGYQKDQGPEGQGNPGVPSVAPKSVLGAGDRDVCGASDAAPPFQVNSVDSGPISSGTLPGPSRGSTSFRQEFSLSRADHDLNEADLDFLSNHLASQTASGYRYSFRRFRLFCEKLQTDPLTCPPAIVVKCIRHLYETGAEWSTMNFHRSSISKFHVGIHGIPMGEHPLVSQAVKAIFRLRPLLPHYKSAFDIVPVLAYICSLPTATVSLQLFSFKALFLTIYSSISRVSSMARLAPSLEETRDSAILHLVSLEKQSREGRIQGFSKSPSLLKIRIYVLCEL